MAFRTKLARAEAQILASLGTSPGRIYNRSDLREYFSKARLNGVLAKHTKLDEFIEFLVRRRHLLSVTLESKRYGKDVTRYCVGKPSPFALAASLRKGGYLSHGTAAYLHKLIPKPPRAIYLNVEQSAKPAAPISLSQPAIDRAFSGKQRQSNLSFENKELTVTIVAGKNTGRTGVAAMSDSVAQGLNATNLHRTLIDLVVRPAYAGGVANVLGAYRAARELVSAESLLPILDKLAFAYPYVQAIGFLMEQTGYSEDQFAPLRARVTEFNFYLAHGMRDCAYAEAWRLFYPRELLTGA